MKQNQAARKPLPTQTPVDGAYAKAEEEAAELKKKTEAQVQAVQ